MKPRYRKIPGLRLWVKASRWPWQGYGWRGTSDKIRAPLAGGARFGGGWRYKLGISIGGKSVLVELIFGMLTFVTKDPEVTRRELDELIDEARKTREGGIPF